MKPLREPPTGVCQGLDCDKPATTAVAEGSGKPIWCASCAYRVAYTLKYIGQRLERKEATTE